MDPKEIHRQFRAAAWPGPKELEVFLLAADTVPAGELVRLLSLLTDKSLGSDAAAHRGRLTAFRRLVEKNPDPQLFVPLVRALKAADPGSRQVIVELLPRCNQVAGHAELAQLMRQPDAGLRKAALSVLLKLGGKSVFDLAVGLVRDEHPGRAECIDLVATVGAYHAIPALEQVVVGGKPQERVQAIKHLGDVRLMQKDTAGALAVLGRVLSDPHEPVQVQALASFAALCSEEEFHQKLAPYFDGASNSVVRAVVEGARRFPSPRTFQALERRFRMGPNVLRLAVLASLEAIGTDDCLPLLAEALGSKHLPVRTRAGEVLSNLSLQKKVNLARTLMWLLRSRDVNVRRMAVEVAKKVGDPSGELWPSLLRFLRDADWWVRERVMDALVEMAGAQLTRHVVGYLQDPSDVVRRYAVDVLMRLKDPQSLGALVRCAVQDTDWWVRERALETIALVKDARAVPYVVDLMMKAEDLRLACLSALEQMEATAAAPSVCALLPSPDVDVRLAALHTLNAIGEPALAEHVQQLLGDVDHRVRAAAKELLFKWNMLQAQASDQPQPGVGQLSALERILVEMARAEGDDLLLAAGRPPFIKRLGKVVPLPGFTALDEAGMQQLLYPHLTEQQRGELEATRDIDFSYEVKTEGLRFRANLFRQNTGLAAVFRIVKNTLLSMEQLGLPPVVSTFGDLKNGLVLVGGPTGSGKSTTLAAIIDYINRKSDRHIVTLEDPIEVVHSRKRSLVNQREIGTHTRTFQTALRSVLREDPDVILVGEMRDLATISFAVTAAETGHLVFGTLHTVSADTTVDRLINAFPSGQQNQVRSMLAESLRAVVCQHLLRRKDKAGRVLAVEVMVNNDAIGNLVRKGKAFQLPSVIATSRDQGMQTMDADLKRLVREGIVSADEAYMKANSKKDFEEFLASKELAAAQAAAAQPAAPAAPARPFTPQPMPARPLTQPPSAPATTPSASRPSLPRLGTKS